MKQIIFLVCTCVWANVMYAQITISYFPFQSVLAVSSNTESLLWVDIKLETNSFFSNSNMEFSPKINFKRTEWVNYYLGAGISINPAHAYGDLGIRNGYFMDLGSRIKPLKNKNVQLVFEISPYVNKEFQGGNFRTRLGISYIFTHKKK